MITVTHQQARVYLSKIVKPIFSANFVQAINEHMEDYTEDQIPELLIKNRQAVKLLIDSGEFNTCSSEILCCFYFRYWISINRLADEEQNIKMGIPDNDKEILKFFLFDYIEV